MRAGSFKLSFAARLAGALACVFEPARLRRIAIMAALALSFTLLARLYVQSRVGLTDGLGHPFGEDFINFWAAPRLALLHRVGEVYDLARFQQFEMDTVGADLHLHAYSYPPILILLTLPLGLVGYVPAYCLWQVAGWAGFALCLRRLAPRSWLLAAVALPAVYLSLWGGQNGLFTAAIIGAGLARLDKAPAQAGAILALMAYKPQFAPLIPVALLAGGHARALLAFCATALALTLAATLVFGIDIWPAYAQQAEMMRTLVLENGEGVWMRMLSAFVFLRHLGLPVAVSYAGQAAVSLGMLAAVALTWRSSAPREIKDSVLALGLLLFSPYFSDYDLAVLAFVPFWLARVAPDAARPQWWLATAGIALAPILASPSAYLVGTAVGGALLLPAAALAVAMARPYWGGWGSVARRAAAAR